MQIQAREKYLGSEIDENLAKEVQINCMIVMATVFRKVDFQARERKRGESARGRNMKKYKSLQSFPEEDGALRGKDFTYSGLSKD